MACAVHNEARIVSPRTVIVMFRKCCKIICPQPSNKIVRIKIDKCGKRRQNVWGQFAPGKACSVQLCVAGFLLRVDMPYDVVGETDYLVTSSLSHFGESLRLGLIFKCITWEVDACRIQSVSWKNVHLGPKPT